MRTLSFLLAVMLTLPLFAQEKSYTSKVNEVTLFLRGAQLERSVNVSLDKGRNTIVLTGLESDLNINSMIIKGSGSFILMDYRYEMKYIENAPLEEDKYVTDLKKKIEALKDSMVLHGDVVEDLENKQLVINTEKNLLLNNPLMKGTSIGDSLDLLAEAVEFLRERYNEINEIAQELKIKLRAEYKIREANTKRLNDMQALLNQRMQEYQSVQADYRLIVTIDADAATQGTIKLSYLINSAGWTPKYEVHVNSINDPIEVVTKASIYQHSGMKWEGVKLNVSTNNPYEQKTKPVLYPWWISPYTPQGYRSSDDYNAATLSEVEVTKGKADAGASQSAADYTFVNTQLVSKQYEIALPYDVATGTSIDVLLQKDQLNAVFRYYIVPSQSRYSFLVARIGDWGKLNLMGNSASVYYQNTLIGQVALNTQSLTDTMEVSLGSDKEIYADRVLMTDHSKNTISGSKKVITQEYEYTIMNSKSSAVTVYVEDQIPMSQNTSIEIHMDHKATTLPFKLNSSTGIITAVVEVPAKGKVVGRMNFQIKYPKEMTVQGF